MAKPTLDELLGPPSRKPTLDEIFGSQSGETLGPAAAFGEGLANAVPFGQRITSGLGALGAAALGAGNVKDLYQQAQDNTLATSAANPVASGLGTVAGTLATLPIGGGLFKAVAAPISAGKGITASALNALGRSVKGGALMAPITAAYSAGEAKDVSSMPEAAGRGAASGAAIGAALPALLGAAGYAVGTGAGMIKGLSARTKDVMISKGEDLFNEGSSLYEKMKAHDLNLKPDSAMNVLDIVKKAVADKKLIPEMHPKTIGVLKSLEEAITTKGVGVGDLDQYRRLLSNIGEENSAASSAVGAIKKAMTGLQAKDFTKNDTTALDLLHQAQNHYSQAFKYDAIKDILVKAEGNSDRIKNLLTKFGNNKDNISGWSASEVAALKEAAHATNGEKAARLLGKMGVDLGSDMFKGNLAGPVLGAVGGGAYGGMGPAVAVPVTGTLSNIGRNLTASGKAEALLKTIESGIKSTGSAPPNAAGSALGRFMMQNKDVPLSALKNIPPDVMQELMGMKPQDADKFFKSLKKGK